MVKYAFTCMRYLSYHLICLLFLGSGIVNCASQDSSKIVPIVRGKAEELVVQGLKEGEILLVNSNGLAAVIRHEKLKLSNESGPSLKTGFSPAVYVVERGKADHHRAKKENMPRYLYDLKVSGNWNGNKQQSSENSDFWGEFDLSKVWDVEDLRDPKSRMILAWWHKEKGWLLAQDMGNFRQLRNNLSSTIPLTENYLDGYPHLILYLDGKLIPPNRYVEALQDPAINALQNNQPPPDGETLLASSGNTDAFGLNWIHYAASWGREDWLERWNNVRGKTEVKIPQKLITPFTLASMHGHAQVIDDLVEAGFDVRHKDELGYAPLHFAIIYGHHAATEVIIDAGGSISDKSLDYIYSPAGLAFEFNQDDIFGLLLSKGAPFHNFNTDAKNSLLLKAALGGNSNFLKFLLSKRAKINHESPTGYSAIDLAIRSGNPEAVKVLLEAGADPNHTSITGRPILFDAITLGEREMIGLLLKHGASLETNPQTPIGFVELATLGGFGEIVSDLMKAGATCKLTTSTAPEILIQAIRSDIPEMVMLAFGQCLAPDFQFYDNFSMDWVIDYYGADKTRAWWDNSGHPMLHPEPQFCNSSEWDTTPKLIAGASPKYDKDMYKRYGKIETRVDIVIDKNGRCLFPRFDDDLPQLLILTLHSAVSTWRFQPPTANSDPVNIKVAIPLVLDNPDPPVHELSQLTKAPRPIEQPPPYYPIGLRKSGEEGTVIMMFLVDEKGFVTDTEVVRSTHPLFGNSCKNVIRYWKFDPGMVNGSPVVTRVRIPIPFRIR